MTGPRITDAMWYVQNSLWKQIAILKNTYMC